MTYNPDYERSRMPGAGLGEYPTQYDEKPISGKWLFITLATIVVLFGSLAFFAGDATVTINDGEITKPLATETPQPVPTAPVTE
jgi:hypothetical protein